MFYFVVCVESNKGLTEISESDLNAVCVFQSLKRECRRKINKVPWHGAIISRNAISFDTCALRLFIHSENPFTSRNQVSPLRIHTHALTVYARLQHIIHNIASSIENAFNTPHSSNQVRVAVLKSRRRTTAVRLPLRHRLYNLINWAHMATTTCGFVGGTRRLTEIALYRPHTNKDVDQMIQWNF
jgi:hypothetical protein